MGGGGTISAMNAAIKRNERKREHRNYFKQKPKYTSTEVKLLYDKKLPAKELYRLKTRARDRGKKEELINIIVLVISICLTIVVLYLLVEILMSFYFIGNEN